MVKVNENKVYSQTVIQANPFPVQYPAATTLGSTAKYSEVFSQQVIPAFQIPKRIVAREVISSSINTQAGRITGQFGFSALGAIQIGYGVANIRISQNGILATNASGVHTFTLDATTGDATFIGTVAAGSIITGYLAVGSAAGDVNGGTTTIDGGKITANSITASQILTNTLTVGTNVNLGTAQTAGQVTTIVGNTITTGYVNALAITVLGAVTAGSLNGVTVTSSSGTSKIVLNSGDSIDFYNGGTLKGQLRGGHNSGIIANVGSFVTYRDEGFYAGTATSGSVTDFFQMYCHDVGGGAIAGILHLPTNDQLFVTSSAGVSLFTVSPSRLYSYSKEFIFNNKTITYEGTGQTWIADNHITLGNGKNLNLDQSLTTYNTMIFTNTYISGGGNVFTYWNGKNAIMDTTKGFRALYCIESPEVWFMDFAKDKESIDPLFMEVTEGEIKFIKCDDGGYQVWRRRNGLVNRRFDERSEREFHANNLFWNTPQQMALAKDFEIPRVN